MMGRSAWAPHGSGVVAAPDLVDGVHQQPLQDGQSVTDAAGGARQVDDQRVPARDPGEPRESAAVGTFARPSARIASGMPGTS